MIHDFEEIIWVESWMKKHFEIVHAAVPKPLKKDFESFRGIQSAQFSVAVALEFVLFIPVTWLAGDYGHSLFFIGFNVILFIDVFIHLAQSLFLKLYTPGVVTAVFVTLPYSVFLFYRLFKACLADWGSLLISLPAGIPLLPLVLLGHKLG